MLVLMMLWQVASESAGTAPPTPSAGTIVVMVGLTVGAMGVAIGVAYFIRLRVGSRARFGVVVASGLIGLALTVAANLVADTADEPVWLAVAAVAAGVVSGLITKAIDDDVTRREENDGSASGQPRRCVTALTISGASSTPVDARVTEPPPAWRAGIGGFAFAALDQPATVAAQGDADADASPPDSYAPRRAADARSSPPATTRRLHCSMSPADWYEADPCRHPTKYRRATPISCLAHLTGSSPSAESGPGGATPMEPSRWLAAACTVAGRDLTRTEWSRYLQGRPYQPTCSDLS
jgi:hypothetical protein